MLLGFEIGQRMYMFDLICDIADDSITTPLSFCKIGTPKSDFINPSAQCFPALGVRDSEINNFPFLLVFRLVFCVASRVTYPDMRPLMRLEYEPKSCAISGQLFISESLMLKPFAQVF
jgi:hypothetical protein